MGKSKGSESAADPGKSELKANRGLRIGVFCFVGELGKAIGDELEAKDASSRALLYNSGQTHQRTTASFFAACSSLPLFVPLPTSYSPEFQCYACVLGSRTRMESRRGRVVGPQARRTQGFRPGHRLACRRRQSRSLVGETTVLAVEKTLLLKMVTMIRMKRATRWRLGTRGRDKLSPDTP